MTMSQGTLIEVLPASTLEVAPAPAVVSAGPREMSWWGTKRRTWHRNALKRTLARIICICQDHEANGVKAGDPIFQTLHAKALSLCDEYCRKWNLDRNALETELPVLRVLRLSAHPENLTAAHKGPVVVFGLLAIVALPLIIGVWTGLFGVGQRWIAHLFGG
jgi:hypothetical protein